MALGPAATPAPGQTTSRAGDDTALPDALRPARMRAALLLGAGGVVAGVVAIAIAHGSLPSPPVMVLLLASALPGALAAAPSLGGRLPERTHARFVRGGIPLQLGLLLAAVAIDSDGAASPLVLLLVLPLLPAAWSLSPLGVCVLGAVGVTGVAVLAHAGDALTATAFAGAAVMGLVTTASGITARAEQRLRETQASLNAELIALAHRDGLTGCRNHRAFQERLDEEVRRAQRYGRHVALVLIDLDDFKGLNDAFGHPAGDRMLRAVGAQLASLGRAADVPGRLGGDEFALLLPETSRADAVHVADRLRRRIDRLRDPRSVTASMGIASVPGTATGPRQLVEQADAALYAAKRTGRGLIQLYGDHPEPPAAPGASDALCGADEALARRLRGVIDQQRLTVAFQPVVRLADGGLVAYDAVATVDGSAVALARWLDLAGHLGLHHELEQAWWAAVRRCGPPPTGTRVFVELSDPRTPGDPDEPTAAAGACAERAGGGAGWHRAVSCDLTAWSEAMTRLSADEAGDPAGLAGPAAGAEPTWLKLPARLVGGCDRQPGRLALIGTLRTLADRAGGELIAEGVGRDEEVRALRAAGVRFGAGTRWGEPGPPWPVPQSAGPARATDPFRA